MFKNLMILAIIAGLLFIGCGKKAPPKWKCPCQSKGASYEHIALHHVAP